MLLTRSWAFAKLGKLDKAITDANKALKIDPDSGGGHNNLGYIYYLKGDYQARKFLDKAIEIDPNYAEAYTSRGDLFSATGDVKAALKDLDRALVIDPGNEGALNSKKFLQTHPQGGRPVHPEAERQVPLIHFK